MDETNVTTIIGPGTEIKGELNSKGTVRIEGAVEGKVQCQDTIVVHETGQIKADLHAAQVIVSGTVNGNIQATERLEVTNQGKIVGDITAPRISIAEGVIFEGKCTMKPVGQTPAKDQAASKEQQAPAKEVAPPQEQKKAASA